MTNLSVLNLKGGVGKTTASACLAVALANLGLKVGCFDSDPQSEGSLLGWARAAGAEFPLTSAAVGGRVTPTMTAGLDWAVFDAPPGDPLTLARSVDAADVILIPTSPSHADLSRTLELADLLSSQSVPATVLLNAAQTGTIATRQALDALSDLPGGITLYEHAVPFRQHFLTMYGTVPKPSQLHPYDLIATELQES